MNRKDLVKLIVENAYRNQDGHIASALSVLDCIDCLYQQMQVGDEFILSKGHASLALYVILLKYGYISEAEFFTFGQFDSRLGGHPSSRKCPFVRFSAGSLGHGFPYAVGRALAKKIAGKQGRIFCLIGDGEANEGTTWESALIASTYHLNNLTCFMDFNKSGERAIQLHDCVDKFHEFGWSAERIDGHNEQMIQKAAVYQTSSPLFVQLNTIKGKGIPMMQNNPAWHHRWPTSEEEYEKILLSISD